MGIPILTPEDLLALRDGEAAGELLDIALKNNIDARRTLLDARLLALALSMPMPGASAPARSPVPTDPAMLEAYLNAGSLTDDLAAFEATVRGNPQLFAELLAFKDAYFGRPRALANRPEPRLPDIKRVEVGTLKVRTLGSTTFLGWERPDAGDERPGALFGDREWDAVASMMAPPRMAAESLQAPRGPWPTLRDMESRYAQFQQDSRALLERLGTELRMAEKSGELEALERLRETLARLQQLHEHAARQLHELSSAAEDAIDELADEMMMLMDGGPWERHFNLTIEGWQLKFSAHPDTAGAISLRIVRPGRASQASLLDTAAQPEFTWIRPNIDFEVLDPGIARVQKLGVIERDSLLLISTPGRPSRVIRIRPE